MSIKPTTIPLLIPDLPPAPALLQYLEKIDNSRIYSNFGPLCRQLECRLAELVGARHTVCVSSGTMALQLALSALDLPTGGKVAIPAITFPATAAAVRWAGLEPVLCDVTPESCLLSPASVLTARSRHGLAAVVPVSLFGHPHDCAQWVDFSDDTGIPVIIDAAGAIGYQPTIDGITVVYSLHATKPLAVGEGGFVATTDGRYADELRSLSNFGFLDGRVRANGTNGKMSEYHAAVGLAALDAWPGRELKYRKLFKLYAQHFDRTGANRIAPILNASGVNNALTVHLKRDLSNSDQTYMQSHGIETRRWYWPPLHRHEAFASCHTAGPLKVTEAVADRLLGLPYHLFLSKQDILRVTNILLERFE